MNYTEDEVKHFEHILNFFDFKMRIDGEYLFYTDDRALDDSVKFKKKVYRDGKRRSVNVYPTSINTFKGQLQLENQAINDYCSRNNSEYSNPFIQFVLKYWDSIVTDKQRDFIIDSINGQESKYSKQQRHQYRLNIQKRLKLAFIGVGGDNVAQYKIGEIYTQIILIDKFLRVDDDNLKYSRTIVKNLNKNYIDQIVYERLSEKARQDVLDFYFKKTAVIPSTTLYEFHRCILEDLDNFKNRGLFTNFN